MTDYTKAELLNEVSKVFRASLEPGRDGGTLNTSTEYQQLLEMASITFLLKPDSIFYLARLAANRLNGLLLQEVAVLEDMLVALDDLSQLGKPVRDTTTLSNARTTVLTLDAAQSVTNRPETARFSRQMDVFANQLRTNLVSVERGGQFARPREEARDIIQANLVSLDDLHTQLLDQAYALKYALSDFLSLDLPSRVSTTVLTTISDRLQATINELESTSDPENLAASRRLFLETLANKISVQVLSTFTDPTEFKFRGPSNPIPSTMKHTGQVIGSGTAASVLTRAGPWTLPVSAPLVLSVSGAAPVTIPLNDVLGAVLNCRNSESYLVAASKRNLHVVVDPNIYNGLLTTCSLSDVTMNPLPVRLGFKHLGAPVSFLSPDPTNPSDLQSRFILDLVPLQWAMAPNISYAAPALTFTSFLPAFETAIGFQSAHLGGYIYDNSGQRFEITKVVSNNSCEIDDRGLVPDTTAMFIVGQLSDGSSTGFSFSPQLALAAPLTCRVSIGPAVKTAQLTAGYRSVVGLIADIVSEAGVFTAGQDGARLNWHVKPVPVSGDPTRLGLQIRSRANPLIQVAGRFLKPQDPAGLMSIVEESAHQVLGLLEGELDTTNLLTPVELAAKISEFPGLVAEVVETTIATGVLNTVAGTSSVAADQDVEALGVTAYDQVLVGEGTRAGVYQVWSAVGTTMGLSASMFTATEANLAYRVFRQQVKISVSSAGPGSSLAVVSAPAELGLTVGTVYSSIPTFEAVDKLGNKLDFTGVVAGDLLRVVGQTEVAVTEVVGTTTLVLASGLPSTTTGVGFTVRSAAALEYTGLNEGLVTFTTSPNLLKKNGFDKNVQAIDNACTAAILPGQNFVSSRNQAKRMVTDLLSILTSTLLRSSEYTATVPTNVNNLSDLLASYDAVQVEEVDDLIEAFQDRKYDRALTLLRGCRFTEFYDTTDETGSFGGAVMAASRTVVKDLPPASRTRFDYLNQRDLATSAHDVADGETDFSDTANEPEDSDL